MRELIKFLQGLLSQQCPVDPDVEQMVGGYQDDLAMRQKIGLHRDYLENQGKLPEEIVEELTRIYGEKAYQDFLQSKLSGEDEDRL